MNFTKITACTAAVSVFIIFALSGCGSTESVSDSKETEVSELTEVVSEDTEWIGTEEEEAQNMLLSKIEGMLGITENGSTLDSAAIYEGMKLISGDDLTTQTDSYAWIDLDDVKEILLDQISQAGLTQNNKDLIIELENGNMFFHISQPLATDESMKINTSSMSMSIRGTTGIIEVLSETEAVIVLLEGKLEITTDENNIVHLETGDYADIIYHPDYYDSTDVYIRHIYQEDIPQFATEQISESSSIQQKIIDNGGNAAPAKNPFIPAITQILNSGELPNGTETSSGYSFAIADVDGDDKDELLFTHTLGEHAEDIYDYDIFTNTWRLEGVVKVYPGSSEFYDNGIVFGSTRAVGEFSIMQYNNQTDTYEEIGSYSKYAADDKETDVITLTYPAKGYENQEISKVELEGMMSELIGSASQIKIREMAVNDINVQKLTDLTSYTRNPVLEDGFYTCQSIQSVVFDENSIIISGDWYLQYESGLFVSIGTKSITFLIDSETSYDFYRGNENNAEDYETVKEAMEEQLPGSVNIDCFNGTARFISGSIY